MINRIAHYFSHSDDRGSIQGLINIGTWEEVNYITSLAGTVRGNHYHKYAQEAFFILEGEIKVQSKNLNNPDAPVDEDIVTQGDFFIVKPFVVHTFFIVKDAKWLNFLSHKVDENNKDFFWE
jgi:quercetin dioxygenase-like cupin family protein